MYDFLLLCSVAVVVVATAIYLRHPAASLMHPATYYLAFHGFIFVVRPIVARFYDFTLIYELYNFMPSATDKITVILSANLALIVFMMVSLSIANQPPALETQAEHSALRQRFFGPIIISTILFAPIAVAAQLYKWATSDLIYRPSGSGIGINEGANGWFLDSGLMLAPIAVLLLWVTRYRIWGWVFFVVFAVLQAGTGGRGTLIYALMAVGMLFLLEKGRRWFDWRLPLIAFLGFLAFNQIVTDRGASVREFFGEDSGNERGTGDELKPLEGMDFANLEYFEYVVYVVPQRSGSYDYFAQNLQILTEPIPRAIWKGKPIGAPITFFDLWDYGTPIGMTMSVPGAGWMAYGWIGVAIQAAIFALIYSWLYRWLAVQRGDPQSALFYVLLVSTTVVTFRDGTLLTLLRVQPFYLGPLVIVILLYRLFGNKDSQWARGRQAGEFQGLSPSPADRRRAMAARAEEEAALRR